MPAKRSGQGRSLLLFGGNPTQNEAAKLFVELSNGAASHVVLLVLRRPGWREYLPRYTQPGQTMASAPMK